MNRSEGYIDVDQLQQQTTLEQAAAKCGVNLDTKGHGAERRIDCPFGCTGDHAGKNEVAINVKNPQKVFKCHAYSCGFRGNMLTLMHGWTTCQKPTGGKLKGKEFQRVKKILAGTDGARSDRENPNDEKTESTPSDTPPPPINIALIDSDNPKIIELHNIDKKFVIDVSEMNPAAAAYVRRHRCLTSESMKKWKCGYLPNDGGGDKRGWSLRGNIVYGLLSETGKVLCWIGRDIRHDEKEQDFQKLLPEEKLKTDPPVKHRFPKGFKRGLELYGQYASRLNEPGYREFIHQNGITIVEGFNDVINLDNYGIPAVAIMSNRISEAQIEKVSRWAQQLGQNRVNLMFDNDDAGVNGAKDALYRLAERQLNVRLAWSPNMYNGDFKNRQPETILAGFPCFS